MGDLFSGPTIILLGILASFVGVVIFAIKLIKSSKKK